MAFAAVVGWISYARGQRVPVLAHVDFGFHELGHLLTYPLPDLVTAAMGSVTQVAVPLGLAAYFGLARHELPQAGVCLAWSATSARDVSTYIADAPYERLELIGGDHDWAYFFHEIDHMAWAGAVATTVKAAGLVLLCAAVWVSLWDLTVQRTPADLGLPGA